MRCDLNEAIRAVESLAEGAARRRRGLDQNSIQWQAFTTEIEAYARATDTLRQLVERHEAETILLNMRTV